MTSKQLDKELKKRGFKVLTRTQLMSICKLTGVDYYDFQEKIIRPRRGIDVS